MFILDTNVISELVRPAPSPSMTAGAYASIAATRRASGSPISLPDAQIAAIAAANGMSVVTRHEADFAGAGVDIINPWRND